jgi:hypothetical protein
MVESKTDSFNQSSLIKLLKSLSAPEIKEFDKFVRSPFHNNRGDVTRFFEVIKNYYPGFDGAEFRKEKVYSVLYPGEKYRDDVMRRLSSNLFKIAEEYGAYKSFRNDRYEFNRHLLEFHFLKGVDSLYLKQQKKTEDFLEMQSLKDAKYFLNVNFLEELKRIFQIKSDPLGKKLDIQKQIDSVWKYAIITLLRLYKVAIENSKQYNKKYSNQHLPALLKIVEESDFTDSKAVEVWYYVIKFHTNSRNDVTFHALKELLEKNFSIFDPLESFIICVSLLSYCFDMNIIPARNFHKEEFEIIRLMFNEGLLIDGNTIHSEWFMFAFLSALRAGDIAYAEKFLNDCKSKINRREQENVVNHALAELALEKKDFNAALKYLSVPKYNNVAEKLRANQMYIKIYFELKQSEQLFYTADSFMHLIRDEASLSKEIKVIRENFVKFTLQVYRYSLGETKKTLLEIRKDIMNTKILGNKWLLRKLDELEGK